MKDSHNSIRTINFQGLKIGGETSFPIFTPMYALNLSVKDNLDFNKINSTHADIIALRFDIDTTTQADETIEIFKKALNNITKPLMLSGSGKNEIDVILFPKLINMLDREVIINSVNENTYKEIIPYTSRHGHTVVLKSPIDINLAKELNILSADLGQPLDKILIDTDIGGLGYGLEYGYSIMEKIKLEGLNGDTYLNMPMISFACLESLKTKEAKTESIEECWGKLEERRLYIEIASASAAKACGADIIVMQNEDAIKAVKEIE